MAYRVNTNNRYLARLVDDNSRLMYNLSQLESPGYLLAAFNHESVEFSSHGNNRYINHYDIAKVELIPDLNGNGFIERFFDFFSTNAEARPRE